MTSNHSAPDNSEPIDGAGVVPFVTPLDKIFEPVASRLPLCGNGAPMNWSVRIADAIIPGDGCGCCTVWRSLVIGTLAGVALGAILGASLARCL